MSGDAADRPLRVVVCGTGFGRIHLRAVGLVPGLRLAGVLARGGDASRGLAAAHGVPLWTDVAELPADVDLASVAVGSAVQGGPGSELVLALLARGIHVLQEPPAHPDESTAAARAARTAGVRYRLSTHSRLVRATRGFLASAERLRARSPLVHVDAAGPVHLLQPLVDILGLAVGGLRPWAFTDPVERPHELTALEARPSPLTAIEGVVGGIPLSLRVHDELHPADRDNHALLWPRIALASEAGVLTLADVHGPVTWSPALHTRRDAAGRLDLDGDPARRALPRLSSWPDAPAPTAGDLFDDVWPDAVAHALTQLVAEIRSGDGDALRAAQADITMARAWVDLTRRLGPPRSIRPGEPPRVTAAAILPAAEAAPAGGHGASGPAAGPGHPAPADPYGPAAELFDLAAAEHAELTAAAVCRLLDGRDLSAAPVLDIGAGTGVIARAVARAHPEALVVAAEPSEPLRAVLTARILDAPGLQERVTVTAGSAPDHDLPDRISAVLLCGVLGHLDAGQRARLWERIAERLLPGGLVVVETMGSSPGRACPSRGWPARAWATTRSSGGSGRIPHPAACSTCARAGAAASPGAGSARCTTRTPGIRWASRSSPARPAWTSCDCPPRPARRCRSARSCRGRRIRPPGDAPPSTPRGTLVANDSQQGLRSFPTHPAARSRTMIETPRDEGGWLRRIAAAPDARIRLVCLPHAGGAASAYRGWAPFAPRGVEVLAVQYPGRGDRYGDPLSPDLDTLAADVAAAVDALPERLPVVLFGHSMGALVAYETARVLAARGRPAARLVVSGRRAPTVRWGGTLHRQDDAALLADLERHSGTAPEILADDDMRRTVLACLRDDYRLVETHRTAPGPGTGCPVSVFSGDADPELRPAEAEAWHRLGDGDAGGTGLRVFRGGHFYLAERPAEVVEAIASLLDPALAFPAPAEAMFP